MPSIYQIGSATNSIKRETDYHVLQTNLHFSLLLLSLIMYIMEMGHTHGHTAKSTALFRIPLQQR